MATLRVGTKRRRMTTPVFTTSQKRPIDKEIRFVSHAFIASATQQQTQIKITSFPCTITGLRWEISNETDSAAEVIFIWAIVLLREGVTASTIGFGGGATVYAPEQDVLAWGCTELPANTSTAGPVMFKDVGTTKTMRKLKEGDQVVFISKPNIATTGGQVGVIQFFCKS